MTDAQRARIEQQLQELLTERDEMSRSLSQFDARISALEAELHGTAPPAPAPAAVAQSAAPAAPPPAASAPTAAGTVQTGSFEAGGFYDEGKGITLASGPWGDFNFNLTAYMRYLNQLGTQSTYTDSFGRTFNIDRRQDFQLAKVQMTFKGWIGDPKFNWNFYVWTSQCEPRPRRPGGRRGQSTL